MKAILLAAGYGSRLKPLTDETPKCLLPIGGKPLLGHWLELLIKHGITEVLINTHHLSERVENYISYTKYMYSLLPESPLRIITSYEAELLGSAGTIKSHARWIGDQDFLVAYADNLTNADLTGMINKHDSARTYYQLQEPSRECLLTMGLFHSDKPSQCGIVTLDADLGMFIEEFVEKPEHPATDWANAGIYVMSPETLRYIPNDARNLARDVFPQLLNKMIGCHIEGYVRDIGTPESYQLAEQEWAAITNHETKGGE